MKLNKTHFVATTPETDERARRASIRTKSGYWLLPLVGAVLVLLQFVLPLGSARQGAAFLLLWIIPAMIWALWLQGPPLTRLVGACGLALLIPVVLTLTASYVPGGLPGWTLALIALVTFLLPVCMLAIDPRAKTVELEIPAWSSFQSLALLAIVLLAVILRLINVEYKEFQGDEGVIMVRAAQALAGDEMALLRHQKGPVEILLPLLPWGLGGSINEFWSRGVFIWAGWLVVPAIAALGMRWFNRSAALVAALLFAIGGFSIAFSRIVQYQSLVTLWTLLSLIFAERYWTKGSAVDLILSATFLAGGLLAHYDAILVAPVILWLVIARSRIASRSIIKQIVPALIVGGAILALFYVPYVANPTFSNTGSYLLADRIGGEFLSWSIPEVWRMATFYNSTYYVILLLFLAAVGLGAIRRHRSKIAAILFLATPLLFYTLVVADPRTHVYTIFPALTLLAGVGATFLWSIARTRAMQALGLLTFLLVLGASLGYVYLLFVDVTPERQRTWTEHRPRYFPTTWSEPPQFGLFGFPHQAGWRLAPSLVAEMPYSSNEEPEITAWYMAQAPRTHCPDYQTFIVAANAQDELPYDPDSLEDNSLQHVVTVNGIPTMHIYGTNPAIVTQLEAMGHDLWRAPEQVAPPMRSGQVQVDVNLGDRLKLLGYTLETNSLRPGETVNIVLFWQALRPIERNYQVFVHLYDGAMWGQHDGAPDCAIQPTSGWEPGQIVRDSHQVQLSDNAPSGEMPLLVGMYDLITGERLVDASTGRDVIHIADFRVTGGGPRE